MRPPGDRENALSWLSKAADAWRAAQSDGALASPDRREMRQVEEAQRELVRLSLDRREAWRLALAAIAAVMQEGAATGE